MHYVYRAINYTKKQVYFGVSKDPEGRRDGSHCRGGTKALRRWNCGRDRMRWERISGHRTQCAASARAHELEKTYTHPQGFKIIQTRGV